VAPTGDVLALRLTRPSRPAPSAPDFRTTRRDSKTEGENSQARRPWVGMPTISRFYGITINMYSDDHGFPHFHAYHADGHAKIRIDTLEVLDSNLARRQLRFVLSWAELHLEELQQNWDLARAGERLIPIEPLG
jgi:hypothetical protein